MSAYSNPQPTGYYAPTQSPIGNTPAATAASTPNLASTTSVDQKISPKQQLSHHLPHVINAPPTPQPQYYYQHPQPQYPPVYYNGTTAYPQSTTPTPTDVQYAPYQQYQQQPQQPQQSYVNPYMSYQYVQQQQQQPQQPQQQQPLYSQQQQQHYQNAYTHQQQQAVPMHPTITDPTGQKPPPNFKPKITTTLWEDEGTLCFQVEARGICVARREDNNMINGTKLLNVSGMTRGRRDGILKGEKIRHVVKAGAMHLKGVWIPYDRALEFANKEKIIDLLYPLFVNDLKALLYHPANFARTAQVLNAAEKKKAEFQKAQEEKQKTKSNKDGSISSAPGTAPVPSAAAGNRFSVDKMVTPAVKPPYYYHNDQYDNSQAYISPTSRISTPDYVQRYNNNSAPGAGPTYYHPASTAATNVPLVSPASTAEFPPHTPDTLPPTPLDQQQPAEGKPGMYIEPTLSQPVGARPVSLK
ncbi:hypothetical protein D0Z00_000237 [Geotrichum galactomycetum]|uniref:Uncharacterized protein n=1 Tax=Geotrichum galactomycetum TaxID=27317 RepID=A0ACB6VAD0_9ASCO|nr:hypothetical protein D0Z00_000237 [Geotrichum candidum]